MRLQEHLDEFRRPSEISEEAELLVWPFFKPHHSDRNASPLMVSILDGIRISQAISLSLGNLRMAEIECNGPYESV